MIKISVKWSGRKFDDIPVDTDNSALELKAQLFSLTGVEPDRQKIMAKGGILKDDADLKKCLTNNQVVMMMGTPGDKALQEPATKIKFAEDMTESELNVAQKIPAGLDNLGNTCYMNATLQCLRAIPELKSSLNEVFSPSSTYSNAAQFSAGGGAAAAEKNLSVAMRDLFNNLESTGGSVSPMVFVQLMRVCFVQFAQQQRGVFMQQDAEECFSSLMSVLERSLLVGDTKDAAFSFVNKYMTGLMEQTMSCDEAPDETKSVSVDKIYRLNCHISQNVNYMSQGIHESLKESIEKMSPTLNRTAVYSRTSRLIRLPKYLTVGFVRFFWKQEAGVKAKIMRAVKYPFDLDVNEFCAPALQEKMKPARDLLLKQTQDRKDGKIAAPEKSYKEVLKSQGVDDSFLNDDGANIHGHYELVAVLTHVGRTADAGHYMAWTRDEKEPTNPKEGRGWWKFDDDKVSAVKEDDVGKLYGGGDWHMAYMLIYKASTMM